VSKSILSRSSDPPLRVGIREESGSVRL
jgi:hypothetical protein